MISCEHMGREASKAFRALINSSRPLNNDPKTLKILKAGIHLGREVEKGEISITKQQLIEVRTAKNTKGPPFMSFTMTSASKNKKKAKIINQRRSSLKICLKSTRKSMGINSKNLICLINETLIS